jgi:hypothetical protein
MNSVDRLHILNTYGKVQVIHNKMDDTHEAYVLGHPLYNGIGYTIEAAIDSLYDHVMRYMLMELNLPLV